MEGIMKTLISLVTLMGLGLALSCSDNPTSPRERALTPAARVRVGPQLTPGDTLRFAANANNVLWSTNGGTITQDGLFTAGQELGRFKVQAKNGSVDVFIVAPPVPDPNPDPPPDPDPPPNPEPDPTDATISPGESIQAAVDAHPAGTRFLILAGTHTQQEIAPKDGNAFIGEAGATLDGEGVAVFAFRAQANDVEIRGLRVINYNNPLQMGAIHAGGHNDPETTGWVIADNEIAFNAGAGLRVSNRITVTNNHIHHNGQLGIGGQADFSVVEGNEIAFNNTRGIDPTWEAGGTKFVLSDSLIVRNNWSHHNVGPGLWTDINNIRVVIEDNLVEDNTMVGIYHEISYEAVIRNNTVRRNGHEGGFWLFGSGIMISSSRGATVTGNVVEHNQSGISVIDQERGIGSDGPWNSQDILITGNIVRQENASGFRVSSYFRDDLEFGQHNVVFQDNDYTIHDGSLFEADGQVIGWMDYRDRVEPTSVFNIVAPS